MKKFLTLLAALLIGLLPFGRAEAFADAADAYRAFLSGEAGLATGERFEAVPGEYYDGIPSGFYNLGGLIAAVNEHNGAPSATPKYAIIHCDGVPILALRLEAASPNALHWTGIICYDGEDLILTYDYTDGYRTWAKLHADGVLEHGGAAGAGAQIKTVTEIGADGTGHDLYTFKHLIGPYASSIGYDLGEEQGRELSPYAELLSQDFVVREYLIDGKVLINIEQSSEQGSPAYARENDFLGRVLSAGAFITYDSQIIELEQAEKNSRLSSNGRKLPQLPKVVGFFLCGRGIVYSESMRQGSNMEFY